MSSKPNDKAGANGPQHMTEPEKLDLRSHDIAGEKIADLLRLFPEIRTESGKLDFERLKLALGEAVDVGKERYGMNWPGKADCFKTIQTPSVATLRPCPEESVNFETSENLIIEGDNLEVLKLLQKSYLGKVKMIYIDPPYNTGNDFIYPDDYAESLRTYLEYTGQVDAEGRKFGTNTDADGRFHSKWLNMMYPRLYLARNLLRADGVFFVSIGEAELANLLKLGDELFGEENRLTICSRVMKTGGQKGVHFSPSVDYVVAFARSVDDLNPFREQIGQKVIDSVYTKIETTGPRKGEKYRSMGLYQAMLEKRANQRYYIQCPDGTLVIPPGETFPEERREGAQSKPTDGDGVWRWTFSRFEQEKANGGIEFIQSDRTSLVTPDGRKAKWNVYYKIWLNDRLEDGQLPGNILEKFESRHSSAELKDLKIPFDFAKPSALIKFLMTISGVQDGDITLDFFAGAASTGHAALELAVETQERRPFICVLLPEPTAEGSEEQKAGYATIADIAKDRMRRVGMKLRNDLLAPNADIGFRVYKLAESNFTEWDARVEHEAEAIEKQLELHVEHIRDGRSADDILYELLLKSGFPLTTPVEKKTLAGKSVYIVAGGALIICLEQALTLELIRAIADAKPERVVCLDAGFAGNDQLKANAVQTFRTKGVTSFKTV